MSYAKLEQVAGLTNMGHQLYQPDQPAAVPDGRLDRRRLPGRRNRAGPVDGRAAGLDAPHTQISLPEDQDRHLARLGRYAATAAADRPECRHRGDLRRRQLSGQKAVDRGLGFRRRPGRTTGRGRARRLIEYLQQSGEWKTRREQLQGPLGLDPDEMNFAFAVAEGAIKGKTKGQYPAPLVALKAIREGCNMTLEEG